MLLSTFSNIIPTFLTAVLIPALSAKAYTPSHPVVWPPDGTYKNTVLVHHNVHRANHSANDVVWNTTLVNYAKKLANTCMFEHNTSYGGGGYGQNIGAGAVASHVSEILTLQFYNAELPYYAGQYGKANPSFKNFEHWGHFSQIVWKATTSIGCATVNCTKKGLIDPSTGTNLGDNGIPPYLTVCNYYPPGNFGNLYGANIGRPLKHPTVYAQYRP
ncbi:MAG: hypothetical protein M1834_009419 [Cirrosporium novae-zelandiae]|nr:MAG: hypothetical protein M1834_009419 [Cirrosporium novae-zelandiae]